MSHDGCAGACPRYLASAHPPPLPAPAPLEERERSVLGELAVDGEGRVTFAGLRRRLGLHQQVLTRTLRRLEGAGLVARDEKGYRATERGFAATWAMPSAPGTPHEVLTVVQALLPPHVSAGAVAERLGRRWFHGLRWHGESDAPGETTLTWLAEPGGTRIRVRVSGGALTVEAELAPDAPDRAFGSLRALLAAVAELYAAPADAPMAGERGFGRAGLAS